MTLSHAREDADDWFRDVPFTMRPGIRARRRARRLRLARWLICGVAVVIFSFAVLRAFLWAQDAGWIG